MLFLSYHRRSFASQRIAIDEEIIAIGLGGLLRGDSSFLPPSGAGEQAGTPAVMSSPRDRLTTGEMMGPTLHAAEMVGGDVAGDQMSLLSTDPPAAQDGIRLHRHRRTSEVMVREWTEKAKRRSSTILVGFREVTGSIKFLDKSNSGRMHRK